jgi:ABC-type branched-subunit amino acid transport system substrate-binding protein
LTGAASETRITRDNPWFFRLLRDAAGQGRYLADYARYQLGVRHIAVFYETGAAGEEFANAFREQAKVNGMPTVAEVRLLPADTKNAASMEEAAKHFGRLPKGTLIVLGSQFGETPLVLRALRDKLGKFDSVGYSSVATDALNAAFQTLPAEARNPGHYTDGVYVAAPQLADVAEYAQTEFAARYRQGLARTPIRKPCAGTSAPGL